MNRYNTPKTTKFDMVLLLCVIFFIIIAIDKKVSTDRIREYKELTAIRIIPKVDDFNNEAFLISQWDKTIVDDSIFEDVEQLTHEQKAEQTQLYLRMSQYLPLFNKYNVPIELQELVVDLSDHYGIDPTIAIGLFHIESTWGHNENYITMYENRRNKNRTFDIGIGQLNSRYHDYFRQNFFDVELINSYGYDFDEFDVYNDVMNMQVSLAYLSHLLTRVNKDYLLALQSYNTGIYNVLYGTVPTSTKKYSIAIVNSYMSVWDVSKAEINSI